MARADGSPSRDATMPVIPGYRIVRRLGSGGSCEVWLAEAEDLFNRPVALKLIRAGAPPDRRRPVLEALREEAERLASIQHPNRVQVVRWLDSPEETGLVLQYVPGGSLADRLGSEGPLDWRAAARYVADVAEGLVAAHRLGLIHRGIEPANILWDCEGDEAVLSSLGVGARLGDPTRDRGAMPYRPPEALAGRIGPPLDVYGLAATLFALITGQAPSCGTADEELGRPANRGLSDSDPRCLMMPEPMERIVRRGLAADPEQRPGLEDFVLALRGTLNQLLADSLMMRSRPDRPDAAAGPEPAGAPEPSPRETEAGAAPPPPVALRLIVSRQVGPNKFVPIAATLHPGEVLAGRDTRRVPPPPNRVRLRTGDRIRIEAVSDRHGFITVFRVGPTGDLDLLYPEEPRPGGTFTVPMIPANQSLQVLDVEVTPLVGHERLLAVWSREPLPLRLDRLQGLAEPRGKPRPASRSYRATRDLGRLRLVVERLAPDDWEAVSVELDREACEPDAGEGASG